MSDTILLAPLSYHIVQSDDEKQFQENSLVQFHRISEVRVLFLANRMYFQSSLENFRVVSHQRSCDSYILCSAGNLQEEMYGSFPRNATTGRIPRAAQP